MHLSCLRPRVIFCARGRANGGFEKCPSWGCGCVMMWKSRRQMAYIDLGRRPREKGVEADQAHFRIFLPPKTAPLTDQIVTLSFPT